MNRLFLFLLLATFAAAQPKALFYMTDNPNSVKSFTEHADKVDILVPAWYSVDGNGLVYGGPNPGCAENRRRSSCSRHAHRGADGTT